MMETRWVRVVGLAISIGYVGTACAVDQATAVDDNQTTSVEVSALGAANDHTVLILAATVTGGASSREAFYAAAAGYTVEVVSDAGWAAKTAADFASYRALILGDPTCVGGTSTVTAAINNRNVWGPVVRGNVILVGTDPVFHQAQGGNSVTQGAVQFAAAEPGLTGAYIGLSCYYHDTVINTPVPLLEPLQSASTGSFTVRGVGCFNNAHKVADHPALATITDAGLSNWSCSVHEAFDHFPTDFLPLAIARGSLGAGTVNFPDGSSGIPYIMARGRTLVPAHCGNNVTEVGEECDDGNTNNCDGCSAQCKIEQPAVCGNGRLECGEQCDDGDATSGDGCSSTCRTEVCGNGILDLGEQCDDGNTLAGDGCSPTCRFEAKPPVARCANRTQVASGTCSVSADINDGSFDPDGNLVGCTQAPAGPYVGLGPHPVTLTCTDTTGLSASCTATVTVVDETGPTLVCPAALNAECTGDLSASVSVANATGIDNCSNPAIAGPAGSALYPLGTTPLTFTAVDSSGNAASCMTSVTVIDSIAPSIQCPVPITAECTGHHAAPVDVPNAAAEDVCSGVVITGPAGPGSYPTGTTAVDFTATDSSGNAAVCATAVTVVDTTAPTIACPAPIVAECTAGKSATVDVPNAIASDICGGVVVTGPAGPASYPLGTSTIGFLTTDDFGNPASCTTTVTVADTKAPVFDPATLVPQAVAGHCDGTPVSFTPPRALDCQSVSVTCTPVAGNSFGANTSTCTATDADGRQTTATITVNVLAPLHFQVAAPLWDDNDPDDIETDGDSTNLFIVGNSIQNKVKVLSCACTDVTSSIVGSATVRLTVRYRDDADPSSSTSIVPTSTGVGGPNGAFVLKDGYLQYNQATNLTQYPSGSWVNSHYFQNVLSVTYDSAPSVVVGQEDVRLESE